MLRRYLTFLLVSAVLVLFTPAHSEMNISASSSLDSFSYDLDNIHIKLEKLSLRWQLLPSGASKLDIDQLKAKRLTITLRSTSQNVDTDNVSNSALPNRISLPLPISVKQAEITEVIIITADAQQILSNVQFNFEGNAKTLNINLNHAQTIMGTAQASVTMQAIKPFALNGSFEIKQGKHNTPYDIKTQISGDLQTLTFETNALIAMQDNVLKIMQGESYTNAGSTIARFSAMGQLHLVDDYPMTIKARVSDFHPDRLGASLNKSLNPSESTNAIGSANASASLNADITLEGKLQPEPVFNVQFATNNSHWQGKNIIASGNLQMLGAQIAQMDILASIGSNRIKVKGNVGQADSHLEWQADLPNLTAFGDDFSGSIEASGSLDGAFDNPALQFKLLAQKLRLAGDLNIEKLEGQANLTPSLNSELENSTDGKASANFTIKGLQYGQHLPLDGEIALKGTRNTHQIIVTAQNNTQSFESSLQGGLTSASPFSSGPVTKPQHLQWIGLLQTLTYADLSTSNQGLSTAITQAAKTIKLTKPAPVVMSKEGASLQHADFQLTNGRALINILQVNTNGFASVGRLDQVTVQDIPSNLLSMPDTLQGNATFSGEWNISANEHLNGNIKLWRETGDYMFIDSNGDNKALGLNTAEAELSINDNQVAFKAAFAGDGVGDLKANFTTTLSKVDSGYVLVADAPLQLSATGQINSLAWLPLPATLAGADFDGQIKLAVKANGTVGNPNLNGNLNGKDLQLTLISEGVALSHGTLDASFEQNQLHIKQASWQGGEGYLSTYGTLLLEQGKPKVDLDWSAEKFKVISRADRLLTLSGTGKTTLTNGILSILGDFNVEKGLIELASENTPTLGNDVFVIGEKNIEEKSTLQILLSGMHIDLGKDFKLRGLGLDAQLTGAVTLSGLTQYHPHTEGSIEVKQGTYMAYGQVLNIERGIFNFSGPMDNPGLNIRAMRNSKPINAGVEITGSAFNPITKLVSDPDVPESEKLSWLVLGHGLDTAGKNDYGLLSLAAGALLSQGQSVPLQTQLARAAGLDEFSFAGGDAESASLTFGKRLTSQLYLSYVKSISGLLDVARLTYDITPRWSLRAEAGTESAVDVLYTFSFK